MQCVILAGGLGTRMKAAGFHEPKALLPIGPRVFIEWQLRWLKLQGVTHVVLSLAHEAQAIEEAARNAAASAPKELPVIEVALDGPSPLGTGGAVAACASSLEEDFLVTYGDTFLRTDASALFAAHRASGADFTLAIYRNEGRLDASNVELRGDGFLYDKTHRTPQMSYIDYGIMAFRKSAFLASAPPQPAFDLSTVMHELSKSGRARAFEVSLPFYEIGSPSGYKGLCDLLAQASYDLRSLAKTE